MMLSLPIADWMAVTEEAVLEVATIALSTSDCKLGSHDGGATQALGAYLALLGHDTSLQVGLLSDASGCQLLSKMLLGMAPEEENLSDSDIADAMCELINVIAGGIKRRVSDRLQINLGLPLFVAGVPRPGHHSHVVLTQVRIADAFAAVLLMSPRTQQETATTAGDAGARAIGRGAVS